MNFKHQIQILLSFHGALSSQLQPPKLMPCTDVSEVQVWTILSQNKHSFSREVFPYAKWQLKWVLHYISLHHLCSWISLNYVLITFADWILNLQMLFWSKLLTFACWLMMQSTRKPGCVCVSQNRAARAWGSNYGTNMWSGRKRPDGRDGSDGIFGPQFLLAKNYNATRRNW